MSNSIDLEDLNKDLTKNVQLLRGGIFDDEITDDTEIKELVPVVTIADSIFAVEGDISIIGGLPKAGKTSVSCFLLATALLKALPEGMDTLGIRTKYCDGRDVVYVDTEQPRAYTNKLRKNVLNLLGLSRQPKNLRILNMRKHPSEEKQRRIAELIKALPKMHLLIIDGVADLIKDPNDTKESFDIIQKFMTAADELNTTIILYIHENPGNTGKLRGNLGSEAERKCGGAITIKKHRDKGVHSIEPKLIRGSEDFEPIYFRYDKAVNRMVSLNVTETAEVRKTVDKGAVKEHKLKEMAKQCLLTGSLRHKDLVKKIREMAPNIEGKVISIRTAATRIKDMVEADLIRRSGELYVRQAT